ncbi:MltA domain-containing protein, partial [Stenotrophomonas maltophilia]
MAQGLAQTASFFRRVQLLQIQGSGRVRLADGKQVRLAYAE